LVKNIYAMLIHSLCSMKHKVQLNATNATNATRNISTFNISYSSRWYN